MALCAALLLTGCTHRVATTTSPSAAPATPPMRATSHPPIAATTVPAFVPFASPLPSATPAAAPVRPAATPATAAFVLLPSPHPYALMTPPPIDISALFEPLQIQTVPLPAVTSAPALVPLVAPDAAPQIISIDVPTSVNSGETVTGDVIASSNVASVEVRFAGYGRVMEKTAPGHFTLSVAVPHVPFFLRRRTYQLWVIARNTRGDAVVQMLRVTVL